MENTNYIWVTFEKELLHRYPEAPIDVEFLKYPHRHMFKFKVWVEVFHNDRDIEFIMFKRFLVNYMSAIDEDMNFLSCEMLSNKIHQIITKEYPKRNVMIEVSEDGENGSFKTYPKKSES